MLLESDHTARSKTKDYISVPQGLVFKREVKHTHTHILHRHVLFDPVYELLVGLGDAVWDAVSHALLPYMVIVDQPPVPESERRTGAVTIYHNLWTTMHKK